MLTIAEWDYDLLPLEIKELQEANFDLSLLGFDADELDDKKSKKYKITGKR